MKFLLRFTLLLMLTWCIITSQTSPSNSNFPHLLEQAQQKVEEKAYEEAIPLGHQCLNHLGELPEVERSDQKAAIYLDILALSMVRLGQLDSSEVYTRKALTIFTNLYGEKHARIADCYHQLGRIGNAAQDFDMALKNKQKALQIRLEIFGAESEEVGKTYETIALTYRAMSDYTQALNYFMQSYAAFSAVLDSTAMPVLNSMNNISATHHRQGDYKSAIAWQERILENTSTSSIDTAFLIDVHINLSNLHQPLNQFKASLTNVKKANQLSEQFYSANSMQLHGLYQTLGNAYYDAGKVDSSIIFYNKAMELYEINNADADIDKLSLLNDFAVLYVRIGDHQQALALRKQVLELAESLLPPDHFYFCYFHNNYGNELNFIQDFQSAIFHFQKALSVLPEDEQQNPDLKGILYMNLANSYRGLKDLEKTKEYDQLALKYYNIAYKNAPNEHTASINSNIGLYYSNLGDYEQALTYYQKSAAIREAVYGADHFAMVNSLPGLAEAYFNVGDTTAAWQTWERTKKLIENELDEDSSHKASLYNTAAEFHLKQQDYEEALASLEAAARHNGYRQAGDFSTVQAIGAFISTYGLKGKTLYEFYQATDDPELLQTAAAVLDTAMQIVDFNRFNLADEASKTSINDRHLFIFEQLIRVNKELQQPAQAFYYAEKSRSVLLQQALQTARATAFANIPDSLIHQEKEFQVQIADLEKQLFERKSETNELQDSLLGALNNQLLTQKEAHKEFLQQLERNHPTYYQLKYDRKVASVESVQADLSDNQTFIEYFVGDSMLFTFVLTASDIDLIETPLTVDLEEQVEQLRSGLYDYWLLPKEERSPERYEEINQQYVKSAYELYEQLLAPLGALSEQLLIVPDGVLGYVPFEALLTEQPEQPELFQSHAYLGRAHQISYNYSATLWQEMKAKTVRNDNFLAFAPSFESTAVRLTDVRDFRRNNLGPLLFNTEEVQNIQEVVGGTILIDSLATEQKFTETASSYGILHFATHAKLDDRNSDYSYLAFAKDTLGDAKIYVRDLYNMQLPAQMVVLSACETGVGQLRRSEGIISFARGFTYAGAKSIITSLWAANDQSTATIMETFYRKLDDGHAKDAALRKSKLEYLAQTTSHQDAHPFHWATFIAIGDMHPLESGGSSWLLWLVLGIAIVAVGLSARRSA